MDCNPPGSSVHGILQAKIHWSGLPCSSPEVLSDPGIEPMSPVSPALQLDSLPPEPPGKLRENHTQQQKKTTDRVKENDVCE